MLMRWMSPISTSTLPDELLRRSRRPRAADRACSCSIAPAGAVDHTSFSALTDYLRAGDLLVLNNTKVFPARLLGHRVPSGGGGRSPAVGSWRTDESGVGSWESGVERMGGAGAPGPEAEARGARPVRARRSATATARSWRGTSSGAARSGCGPTMAATSRPPSTGWATSRSRRTSSVRIGRRIASDTRRSMRASAGPLPRPPPACTSRRRCSTALAARGVERTEVTLHVGYGTFKPVRAERVEDHVVDPETFTVSPRRGGRVDAARGVKAGASSPSGRRPRGRSSRWSCPPKARWSRPAARRACSSTPATTFQIVDGIDHEFSSCRGRRC